MSNSMFVNATTAAQEVECAEDSMSFQPRLQSRTTAGVDELKVCREKLAESRGMPHSISGLPQFNCCDMVSASPKMRRVFDLIDRFKDNPSNILIEGETGTGKEQVGRALHNLSSNAKGPFVAVGCAAVPRELAESELFGHESGAFTGASRRRKGRIEMAQGGTLFLDDVDDMPLELQGKLLRVIEERRYERVGGEQTLVANLRIVSTSKANLQTLVRQGKFRDDLMYRLRALEVLLPPLRERPEDVPALANHFLNGLSAQRRIPLKTFKVETLNQLLNYSWPGNVRELRHAVEYALAMSRDAEIAPADLPRDIAPNIIETKPPLDFLLERIEKVDLRALTADFEQAIIEWALKKAAGNHGKASQYLSIQRSTLQSKVSNVRSRDQSSK